MGMYTEINVCFDLLRDTPKDIAEFYIVLLKEQTLLRYYLNINFSSVIDGTW